MSTPTKVEHGVEEEGRGTGTTPVKVGRVAQEERGSGTSPVRFVPVAKVEHGVEEEGRGTGTTPVKVGRVAWINEIYTSG
jgi:hypothetical protein